MCSFMSIEIEIVIAFADEFQEQISQPAKCLSK